MAENTPFLDLYKKDPVLDKNDTFNITTMLNENWDKIDTKVESLDETKADKTYVDSEIGDIPILDISGKVDKVPGKGLSKNDYSDEEKQKVADNETNLGSHLADYAYQTPTIVGTQIRLSKQSNTERLYFKLDDDLSDGNITISLNNGATSKPLTDIEGENITELNKGFVEVVEDTVNFTYAPRGGANLKGKQVVKVFCQLEEPEEPDLGHIWIKTDEAINIEDVMFRGTDPEVADVGDVVVRIKDTIFKFDTGYAMDYIGIDEQDIYVNYPQPVKTLAPTNNHIQIWGNAYMETWSGVGAVKIWNDTNKKWTYNRAYYWNGDEWTLFSFGDFYPHVAQGRFVTKLNPDGTVVWQTQLSQPPDTYSSVKAIAIDIEGYTYEVDGLGRVMKLSPAGVEEWLIQLDTADSIYGVAVDSDKHIYAAQGAGYDGYVNKLSRDGILVWRKKINKGINGVALDNDEYIYTSHQDGNVSKLDLDGTAIWSKRINGTDHANAIAIDPEGYIYMVQNNGKVNKLDFDGTVIWKTNISSHVNKVAVDSSGYVYASLNDGSVVKFSSDGVLEWQTQLTAGVTSLSRAIAIDPEGYIYAGQNDGKVTKLNPDGTVVWQTEPQGVSSVEGLAVFPLYGAFSHLW